MRRASFLVSTRPLLLALLAGLLGLSFGACSSDDEKPPSLNFGGSAGAGGSGGGGTGGSGALDAAGEAEAAVVEAGPDVGNPDAQHCGDSQKSADESDVDCGGFDCAPCADNKNCAADRDCQSAKCSTTTNTCSAPSCTDRVKNGNESDVDCGGPNCPDCDDNKLCVETTDCKSGVCAASTGTPPVKRCKPPTCVDGVKNGDETDRDCGGSCPSACGAGQGCTAPADCASGQCDNKQCACPPGMVIALISGGGSFCIDAHEVTYQQYIPFWQGGMNPSLQIAECTWNANFTPTSDFPNTTPDLPVRYVDWCDAYAYCRYAGKRLCGRPGGGATPFTSYGDATQSLWFSACTAGVSTYPYGASYQPAACNGVDADVNDAGPPSGPLSATRASNTCQGAAPGLYDMSGNVAEWEDSCDGTLGANDACHARGGGYQSDMTALACGSGATRPRNTTASDLGFRCCAD